MNRDDEQRVVVTGLGAVTSNANNANEFARSLASGSSGITHWHNMDERIYSKIGGDLYQFNLNDYLNANLDRIPEYFYKRAKSLLKTTPLSGRVTTMACLEAFLQAGLADYDFDPTLFGHIMGGHNFHANYAYENTLEFIDEPEFIDGLFGLYSLDNDVLSVASDLLNLQGVSFLSGGACASGNLALVAALDQLRLGRAERLLVAGGLAALDPVILQGWAIMESLSIKSFNDAPTRASRPFDALREGFVPGHGAGAVILETLSAAKKRDAVILAELLGGYSCADASRLTKPDMAGQARSVSMALKDAGVNKSEVDYINAHATSTPLGDEIEIFALKSVFAEHAYKLAVNSTKSMIGHCLLAAGAVEFVATILQLQQGFIHPTINQEQRDPKLDLDFVPNEARQQQINIAISNSFGFGGLNSTVVVGAFRE